MTATGFDTEIREVVRAAAQLERADGRWHTQHEIALHAGWLTPERFAQGQLPIDETPEDYWAETPMWILWIAATRAAGMLLARRDDNDPFTTLLHTAPEAPRSAQEEP